MDEGTGEPVGPSPRHPFDVFDHAVALDRIREAVQARRPFSLIRTGDGEAVLLSVDETAWLHDIAELHRHWGAERVTLGDALRLRRDLEAALAGADLIGIRPDVLGVTVPPDLLDRPLAAIGDYVREHFNLREPEKAAKDKVTRRLALTQSVSARLQASSGAEVCSSWIHWEMLASGLTAELLDAAEEVVLVTSHPELGPVVTEKFDVRTHLVTVPGKFVDTGLSGAHVPDRYDAIRSELTGFPPGTLALVGAGIPGKIYCHWLKEAGCVALDVGSTLDAWMGRASRSVMLRERFGVSDGKSVPAHLRLTEPVPGQPSAAPPPGSEAPARAPGSATGKAERQQRRTARRLENVEVRLERAKRQRSKAERQRDAALDELATLRGRRSVRAVLAAARLLGRR
jgi:hypothetical protein